LTTNGIENIDYDDINVVGKNEIILCRDLHNR